MIWVGVGVAVRVGVGVGVRVGIGVGVSKLITRCIRCNLLERPVMAPDVSEGGKLGSFQHLVSKRYTRHLPERQLQSSTCITIVTLVTWDSGGNLRTS